MKFIRKALESLQHNLRKGPPDLVYPMNQMDAALNESALHDRSSGGEYLEEAFAELEALEAAGITVELKEIPARKQASITLPKRKRGGYHPRKGIIVPKNRA